MKYAIPSSILCGALLAVTVAGAQADAVSDAAPKSVSLTGTTSYDEWTSLSSSGTGVSGSFPGTGSWTNTSGNPDNNNAEYGVVIASGLGGDSFLRKVSNGSGGGPYPSGSSIYYGGISAATNNYDGTLAVTDSNVDIDINTIVFQIEIGEAWTYDFYNGTMPTLSYTTSSGTVSGVVATFSSLIVQAYNGTVTMPTGDEAIYINLYALQWDLSGVTDPITSYSISWDGVQHAQLYALRLDASSALYDSAVLTAVPEPSSYAAATAVLLGVLVMFRSRKRRLQA